jgi:acyl-[acyl-carrier-protein]-phospholipid O-acyltransferase / long-chain-fatty-acid--[acyl-carrier-protein] ligase
MQRLLKLIVTWLFRVQCRNFDRLNCSEPVVVLANGGSFGYGFFLKLFLGNNVTMIQSQHALTVRYIIQALDSGKNKVVVQWDTLQHLAQICSAVGQIACKRNVDIQSLTVRGLEGFKLSRMLGEWLWFPQLELRLSEPWHHHFPTICSTTEAKENSRKLYEMVQTEFFGAKHKNEANLFDQMLDAATRYGMNKIAAEDMTTVMTYKQIVLGSYILGKKFDDLCKHEKSVGILLPTSVGHLITLFSLCYLGKTPSILNFSSGIRGIIDCAELSGIHSIITSRLFIEKAGLEHLIDNLAGKYRILYLEDVKKTVSIKDKLCGIRSFLCKRKAVKTEAYRIILFTSGSENKPKGVLLQHSNIIANVNQLSCAIDFTSQDKMLNVLPMFHSFGLTGGAILPILSGMEVYLYPSPLHYKVIPEIACVKKPTILLGTSTFLMGYAKNANDCDFRSIRYVLAGGEKLKEEVRALWRDKFGIHLLEAYGATEAAPGLCISSPMYNKNGSVGKFIPGIDWRLEPVEGINEGGNLLVRGPNIMEGYILHGQGFVPVEPWYDCGDVVCVDAEGYCTIKARLKRFAKISGEMVSLNQLEDVAEQCFQTDQNAAVSVPDLKKGEKIILYTTERSATKQRIREYISKIEQSMLLLPTEVIIVEALPVLGSGKTDYVLLQEMAFGVESGME